VGKDECKKKLEMRFFPKEHQRPVFIGGRKFKWSCVFFPIGIPAICMEKKDGKLKFFGKEFLWEFF
jgi:hypothetical protein